MKEKILIVGIIVIIGLGGYFLLNNQRSVEAPKISGDYKNIEYLIDGKLVKLTDGLAETPIVPDSATKAITRYFGNEVRHDLNDDGREDVAFLLTQDLGGSGIFYYVVAALNTPDGYVGSDAFLLGDRIAPQTTGIDEGSTTNGTKRKNVVVVNYAIREQGEPMTARPSIGKSVWLKLDPTTMRFGEVAPNFEGESDIVKCQAEERNVDACIEIYKPVCANVEVQCIKAPCDPVPETFSNSCFACQNPLVEGYREGECKG